MKTHEQNMIERLRRVAENRCNARQATELLAGEWQAQGVAPCPVCRTAKALRLRDNEDSGTVAFWCVAGCSGNAIIKAVAAIMSDRGVDMCDRPPWVGGA
jgi:hypothetical protein